MGPDKSRHARLLQLIGKWDAVNKYWRALLVVGNDVAIIDDSEPVVIHIIDVIADVMYGKSHISILNPLECAPPNTYSSCTPTRS